MKYPNINRLYKYYPNKPRSIAVLRNMTFWFAKPDSLNDPFDCKMQLNSQINVRYVRNILPGLANSKGITKKQAAKKYLHPILNNGQIEPEFKQLWKRIVQQANKDLENSGVFCLSERNDSILMWSHYANSHRGFCIEFERHPENDFGDYEKTRKVRYINAYPVVNILDRKKSYDYKFYRKATEWKYEKEWRIINEEGDIEVPLSVEISAIIFGLKTREKDKTEIRQILPSLQCRQCTKAPNQFGLKIVDL